MPLALALLNVSNPTLGSMDALSRLSHDTDVEVAQNAVVSLGKSPLPGPLFCVRRNTNCTAEAVQHT